MRARFALLFLVAALLCGCIVRQCQGVSDQLAALDVTCTDEDFRWTFTVRDCLCECTASKIQDWAFDLGCARCMVIDAPGIGSCTWHVELVTGPMPEHGGGDWPCMGTGQEAK